MAIPNAKLKSVASYYDKSLDEVDSSLFIRGLTSIINQDLELLLTSVA